MDRLAESVGFTGCTTVNPVCTPARSALLTGKYAHQIGMLNMSGDLSPLHPTYPKALQKAGYRTYGIGKFHWLQGWKWGTPPGRGHPLFSMKEQMKRFGFDEIREAAGKQLALQNHCDYCEDLERKGLLSAYREFVRSCGSYPRLAGPKMGGVVPFPFAEENYMDRWIADQIIDAVDRRPKDAPFFIFGSFVGPHPPYDPPAAYLEKVPYEEVDDFIVGEGETPLSEEVKSKLYELRRAYKAMILYLDDQIGRILAKLEDDGLLDETVILFTSDHGEMLGDHGRMQKGSPYRSSLHVPAAIRHPDYLDRRLNDTPVEIIDFAATILEIAGLDPQRELSLDWPAFHDSVPCRSLLKIVEGKAERVRDFAFAECDAAWQMVRSDRYKYVRYCHYKQADQVEEQLFDLETDPDETVNRIADPHLADVARQLRRQRELVMDMTPPAQLRWAPLIEE
jgi:choline-sulfatase